MCIATRCVHRGPLNAQKILDYDLYLMALSKDGIPYELISSAIPSIEREINYVSKKIEEFFKKKI